jgi:hypothetical protein
MLLSSWLSILNTIGLITPAAKPRRQLNRGYDVDVCVSRSPELFEERTLLSAAPVVDLALVAPVAYTEGTAPVVIAPSAAVTDIDSLNFDGGNLTASLTANGDTVTDVLAINNQGTGAGQIGVSGTDVTYGGVVIGTYTGGTAGAPLVVTFDADATVEAVDALQQNITFSIVGDSAITLPRTFQTVITDAAAGNASTPAIATIDVQEAVPVVTPSRTSITVKNSSAQAVDPGITITTAGTETINGAVLTVSLTGGTTSDQLGVLNFGLSGRGFKVKSGNLYLGKKVIGTITGGTEGTPLAITFNGNATLADAQRVARNISFRSIGHATHEADVAFQFSSGDGGASVAATVHVSVKRGGKSSSKPGNPNGNGNHGHGNH